jgi:hypothetical protein
MIMVLLLLLAPAPPPPAPQVRLVLEYCDKGCLREALDSGAFLLAGAAGRRGLALQFLCYHNNMAAKWTTGILHIL